MSLSQGSVRVGFQGLTLKAWAKFNGTTGAIDSSFNIASIVRTLAGTYTVTFTAALAGARYVIPFGTASYNKTAVGTPLEFQTSGRSTASFTLTTKDAAGTARDDDPIYFEVYE